MCIRDSRSLRGIPVVQHPPGLGVHGRYGVTRFGGRVGGHGGGHGDGAPSHPHRRAFRVSVSRSTTWVTSPSDPVRHEAPYVFFFKDTATTGIYTRKIVGSC